MTSTILFYIFIGILIFNFLLDSFLDYLNAKHFKDELPPELKDVYDKEEYKKSQDYKATNQKFSNKPLKPNLSYSQTKISHLIIKS